MTTAKGAAAGTAGGGSRRAALLEQGAGLSRTDVDRLKSHGVEARAELAAKFGRQFDELIGGKTKALASAVLELLVRDVENRVRQALSEAVASSPNLPPAIAGVLARDRLDVARPVLEQSPVLTDDDLIDIVRTHAMQHALAVAGREQLSGRLAETLAATGSPEVVRRLVGNAGAELSDRTVESIRAGHQEDKEIQDRLIKRPALPYELVDQLVGEIGERFEWELVRNRRMTAADARQLMSAVRDTATLSIVARDHGEQSIEREMRKRLVEGDLGPEAILAHLKKGEIRYVEAGLALLADVDSDRARRLLYGMDKRSIAALCVRAGLGTPHYIMLRMTLDLAEKGVENHGRDAIYSEDSMRYVQRQYQDMLANPALVEQLVDG